MRDLSEVKAVAREVKIVYPDTKAFTGLTLTLLPESSKEVKVQQRKNTDHRLRSKKKNLTAGWIEDSYRLVLIAAVSGWNWGENEDGDPALFHGEIPEFTKENVEKVFTELDWIVPQVQEEFEDTEAFFAG
mgnify:CR=1 FL=1